MALACRDEDLLEPGDHFVTEIGKESILLVRQKDNTVKAFYNVCHHRGNRLVHSFEKPQEQQPRLSANTMIGNIL